MLMWTMLCVTPYVSIGSHERMNSKLIQSLVSSTCVRMPVHWLSQDDAHNKTTRTNDFTSTAKTLTELEVATQGADVLALPRAVVQSSNHLALLVDARGTAFLRIELDLD